MSPSSSKWPWLAAVPMLLTLACAPPRLEPGETRQLTIAEGTTQRFSLHLEAGQFTHLEVEQESVDVLLALEDGAGQRLGAEIDANPPPQSEHLYFIPERSGRFELAIQGLDVSPGVDEKNGRFSIHLKPATAPSAEDRLIAEASWIEAEGYEAFAIDEDSARAAELYTRAISLWLQVGRLSQAAGLLLEKATCYYNMGLPSQSRQSSLEAIEIAQELGNEVRIVHALRAAGIAERQLGRYQDSLDHQNQALEIATRLGNQDLTSRALNSLCVLYGELGRLEQARHACRQALEIHQQQENAQAQIRTLSNLGEAHFQLGEFHEAINIYQQALAIELPRSSRVRSSLLFNHGRTLFALGENGAARATLERALALSEQLGEARFEANTRVALARVLLEQSQTSEARAQVDKALDATHGFQGTTSHALVLAASAEVDLALADLDSAIASADRAFELLETSRQTPEDFIDRATFVDSKWSAYDLRVDLRMHMFEKTGDPVWRGRALHAAEQARARSLVDMLVETRDSATLGILTPEEIQDQILGPDAGLLQFHLGRDRSFLWGLTSNKLEVVTLPPAADIESTAQYVYGLLTAREHHIEEESVADRGRRVAEADRKLEEATHSLARMLGLHRILEPSDIRRWLVVSDGVLHRIPFAALPLNATGGPPILATFELSSLPSASALAALRGRPEPSEGVGQTLIIADPVFESRDPRNPAQTPSSYSESGLSRLSLSRQEGETLAAMAPGGARLETDHGASKELLLAGDLQDYRYLHFATHGLLSGGRSQQAALMLSLFDAEGRPVDGRLSTDDIYGLDLSADLVVLSACQSARGRELRGEGLIGLTQGFMSAGAPRVVASLWTVQDGITRGLMVDFYDRIWRRGMRPAAALRAAQLELWRQGLPPYYWASFIHQGDWR